MLIFWGITVHPMVLTRTIRKYTFANFLYVYYAMIILLYIFFLIVQYDLHVFFFLYNQLMRVTLIGNNLPLVIGRYFAIFIFLLLYLHSCASVFFFFFIKSWTRCESRQGGWTSWQHSISINISATRTSNSHDWGFSETLQYCPTSQCMMDLRRSIGQSKVIEIANHIERVWKYDSC